MPSFKKSLIVEQFQGNYLKPVFRLIGLAFFRASDILRKKAKFCGIFGGKFAEKSADFAGFSWEKSQNSQKKLADFTGFSWEKNRLILRDFSRKKSNFEGFSGANS